MYKMFIVFFYLAVFQFDLCGSQNQLSHPGLQRVALLLRSQNQAIKEIDERIEAYSRDLPLIALNMLRIDDDNIQEFIHSELIVSCAFTLEYYRTLKSLVLDRYSQEQLLELKCLDKKFR